MNNSYKESENNRQIKYRIQNDKNGGKTDNGQKVLPADLHVSQAWDKHPTNLSSNVKKMNKS